MTVCHKKKKTDNATNHFKIVLVCSFSRAEQLDYDVALNLTLYLDSEDQYVPWDAAYENLMWLSDMLRYQPAYGNWRVRQIAKNPQMKPAKRRNMTFVWKNITIGHNYKKALKRGRQY